jgi:hypothetical protein
VKTTRDIFEPGIPLLLGPHKEITKDLSLWDSVRIEAGWQDDMFMYHKYCVNGLGLYDPRMPKQPHGYALTEQVLKRSFSAHESLLLPDGRVLLDPNAEDAPDYPWRYRAHGSLAPDGPPPDDMPKWYMLDHSAKPNLAVAKHLYKIQKGDTDKFYRAIVFVSTGPILSGTKLTIAYESHPSEWCEGCTKCF